MAVLTVGDTTSLTGSVNADLTGATGVEVHLKRPDASVIEREADVVDAVEGDWTFDLIVGDLDQAGTYRIEVKVTFSNGEQQTFGTDRSGKEITFKVRNFYAD